MNGKQLLQVKIIERQFESMLQLMSKVATLSVDGQEQGYCHRRDDRR